MKTSELMSKVIYCASTTDDILQNAKNALRMLEEMNKKAFIFSFTLYFAIKRQKRVIAHIQSKL